MARPHSLSAAHVPQAVPSSARHGIRVPPASRPGLRRLASFLGVGVLAACLGTAAGAAAQVGSVAPAASLPTLRTEYRGQSVVRVTPRSVRELRTVLALTGDIWSHGAGVGPFDVMVTPEQLAALRGAGVPLQVLIEDVQTLIDAERQRLAAGGAGGMNDGGVAGDDWYADVKDAAAIQARLDAWVAAHPSLVSPVVIGTSLENRQIRGVRIGTQPEGQLPGFLFNACQHAREWATPMTAMLLAETLIEGAGSDPRIDAILAKAEVYVVPVSNPDGYQYSWDVARLWRKNRRNNGNGTFGVDLNRNWGYQWGGEGASTNPADETYRGPAAFSEPETQAFRDWVQARPSLVGNIDFHSYSQLILWPWGWTASPCPDDAAFGVIGGAMQDGIQSVWGRVYTAGPIYTTIYPASGGAVDWMYGSQGIYSYTIEVRDTGAYGFIIPPEEVLPNAQENTEAALRMMELVLSPAAISLASPLPAFAPAQAPLPVSVSVTAVSGQPTGAPTLWWRSSVIDDYQALPMSASGAFWTASIPGAVCGARLDFFVEVATTAGDAQLPLAGEAAPFSLPVLTSQVQASYDFETAAGWTAGAPGDNATAGLWVRVNPVGTAAQPEDDVSANGTMCWVTGQGTTGGAVGAADVDGGITSLTSPALPASTPDAVLRYWRWYSNNQGSNPGQDSMLVQYSTDGGAAWSLLEDVSENAGAWVQRSFRIGDFVPEGAASFQLRFVARDLGGGSVVEAGVDEVRVELVGCAGPAGDLDGDGHVSGADLGILIARWGSADALADLNDDGHVDGADLGILIANWSP